MVGAQGPAEHRQRLPQFRRLLCEPLLPVEGARDGDEAPRELRVAGLEPPRPDV
jgi:hypothetical protein